MPEMMLSSMSDPSDTSDDVFNQLANLPTLAGQSATTEVKAEAEKELQIRGKSVEMDFKVSSSSTDVKV